MSHSKFRKKGNLFILTVGILPPISMFIFVICVAEKDTALLLKKMIFPPRWSAKRYIKNLREYLILLQNLILLVDVLNVQNVKAENDAIGVLLSSFFPNPAQFGYSLQEKDLICYLIDQVFINYIRLYNCIIETQQTI